MKTYNQKARKREPFKPISNEFDFWVCYEVIFRRRVQIVTREEKQQA